VQNINATKKNTFSKKMTTEIDMRKPIITLVMLLFMHPLAAQNSAPEVNNVLFSQRTDGSFLVDIRYDLYDADGDEMTVSLAVSGDGGATWGIAATTLSGDVGAGITSGTGKTIVWDFAADHPNTSGAQYQFKVIADDGRGGGGDPGAVEWVLVPAGDYTWGEDDAPRNIAYDYYVSKYEITNAQYVAYLEAALAAGSITVTSATVTGAYAGDEHWGAGTYEFLDLDDGDCRIAYSGGAFSIDGGYENHPVVEVTWFGANAYALHYGWTLPTEEEWEKAARGNTGYDYPWGNSIVGSRANSYNSGDPFDNGTTPVGYYDGSNHGGFQTTDSPSPYGAYDMAGNVWEWTLSFYSPSSGYRVLRGGGWYYRTGSLQAWGRSTDLPIVSRKGNGFRVSRTD
jgi:formylglycine-generating enzyme required for sulfatase activity